MEETIYTSLVKSDNWKTLSIRRRIERFTSRREDENDNFEFELLPSMLLSLEIDAVPYDDEGSCLMRPFLAIDNEMNDFKFKVWLENIAGEKCPEIELGKDDYENGDDERVWYFKYFDFSRFNPREFFTDDVAIVCLEISYYVSTSDQDSPAIDSDFRQKLWQSYEMGLSDLTLKVGSKEIKASKAILAAQSGVFKAMLSLNSIEAQTGVVEMDDASYEVIHAFVEFMYLESTDKLEVLAEQLYVLADKYDVPKLKYQCVKQLKQVITDENVLNRMTMGLMYNDVELKQAALKHVMNEGNSVNYSNLSASQEWFKLGAKNPKLAGEIWGAIFSK